MAIPTITPYSGGVANPDGSQTQTEFTQNMFDQLSYEAQLASELNATVNATNTTASEVASDAAIAQNSADSAQAAANFEGDFTVGVTSAVKGKSYLYSSNVWLCLQNTTSTPSNGNAAWKISIGEQYVTDAQEDLLPLGSKLFKGDDGVYLKNGDTVPAGTTHIRVLVGGDAVITELYPKGSSGLVSMLDEPNQSVSVGGVDSVIRLTSHDINDPVGWGPNELGIIRCYEYTNSVVLQSDITITDKTIFEKNDLSYDGNGYSLIWEGLSDIGNSGRDFGALTFKGSYTVFTIANATADFNYGENEITVDSTAGFTDGGYAYITFLKAGDKTTDLIYDLRLLVKTHVVDATTVRIDYRAGFNFSSSDISIYHATPVTGISVKNFKLNDQQVVTPTTSIGDLPPLSERNAAICGVVFDTCAESELEFATTQDAKWPVVLHRRTNNVKSEKISVDKPIWWGPGAGYGIQVNDGLNCSVGAKGFLSRHAVDFTGSAYCEASTSGDYAARNKALLTHGRSEHNIDFINCFGDCTVGQADTTIYGDLTHSIQIINSNITELRATCLSLSISENSRVSLLETTSYSVDVSGNTKIYNANILNQELRTNAIIDVDKTIKVDESSVFAFRSSPKAIDGFDQVILSGTLRGDGSIISRVDIYNAKEVSIPATLKDVIVEFRQNHEIIDLRGASSSYTKSENGKVFQTRDLRATNDTVVINASNMQLSGGPATLPGDKVAYFFNGAGQTQACNVAIISKNNSLVDFDSASRINSAANFTVTQLLSGDEIYVNCPTSIRSV